MITRPKIVAGVFVLGLVGLITAERLIQRASAADQATATVEAPRFEVDPAFPKPVPNGMLMGMAIGVAVTQPVAGVWITMSGLVFDPRKARKNRERVIAVETERVEKDRQLEAISRERETELMRIEKEKEIDRLCLEFLLRQQFRDT